MNWEETCFRRFDQNVTEQILLPPFLSLLLKCLQTNISSNSIGWLDWWVLKYEYLNVVPGPICVFLPLTFERNRPTTANPSCCSELSCLNDTKQRLGSVRFWTYFCRAQLFSPQVLHCQTSQLYFSIYASLPPQSKMFSWPRPPPSSYPCCFLFFSPKTSVHQDQKLWFTSLCCP